jgi:hypothetical protein
MLPPPTSLLRTLDGQRRTRVVRDIPPVIVSSPPLARLRRVLSRMRRKQGRRRGERYS